MKFFHAIISWICSPKRLPLPSANGPLPTLQSCLPSSVPKSTAAPSVSAKPSELKAGNWKADPRTEKNLATLEPITAKLVRELVRRLQAEGLNFKVTSATRTWDEQNALYNQRPVVTNARAGYSWHNFGLAADLTLFDKSGRKPIWEGQEYSRIGVLAKELGLEWGGSWRTFKDLPHVQRNIGLTLAQARAKYPGGIIA